MVIPEELIPLGGMLLALAIVAIVFWHRTRVKELQFHQDLRIREMEHQTKLKQLEIELEQAKQKNS